MTTDQAFAQGVAQQNAGNFAEAERIYRQILAADPNHVDTLHHLGLIADKFGHREVAVQLIERSLAIRPTAGAWSNLGGTYRAMGRLDDAEKAFRAASKLAPNNALIYSNFAGLLWQMKRFEQCVAACKRAIELDKNMAPAWHTLMNVLGDMGDGAGAVRAGKRAVELAPNVAPLWSDLAIAHIEAGDTPGCIAAFEKALLIEPGSIKSHYNFATGLFLMGHFERAFEEYEWRWLVDDFPSPKRSFQQPQWDGSVMKDKTVLLHAEQGFGDGIMFARYLPMAAERARIIVECQAEIVDLLKTIPGPAEIIPRMATLPAFDFHLPFITLGKIFHTTVQTIPADVPYLKVDPVRVEKWRARLAEDPENLHVGIVWKGRPTHTNDINRSMSLSEFAPLTAVKNVTFYSLQKGPASRESASPPKGLKLIDWTEELNDFSDTAALVDQLDLVIAVDTSVVHLAGALAKPVWTMLPFAPDWRWLLSRPNDSPWYPTMKLFRQTRPRNWDSVFARIVRELKALAQQREKSKSS